MAVPGDGSIPGFRPEQLAGSGLRVRQPEPDAGDCRNADLRLRVPARLVPDWRLPRHGRLLRHRVPDVIAALGAQFCLNDCYVNGNVAAVADASFVIRPPVRCSRSTPRSRTRPRSRPKASTSRSNGRCRSARASSPSTSCTRSRSRSSSTATNSPARSRRRSAALPDYKSMLSVAYNVGDWTLFGRWTYHPAVGSQAFRRRR